LKSTSGMVYLYVSMKVDYITLSIPIFFILIGIELLYSLKKKVQLYRVNDSVTNISLGIGQQVTGVFMKTALFYGYLYLYENVRFYNIEQSLWSWIILFLGVDFFYYWFHRLSHEVNVLWAAHIVHHQSEDYNLSVALRQSWFQNAFSWVFYLPLALIGFDPIMFLTLSSFNTLYQFWIHTRTINKMGPLEWIFNTPSHHRVHHGSDPKYLDKYHGGTLIIWDRLFGTFQEELEEPHYGITKPLKSWNPLWANFHYWKDLFKMADATPKLSEKIQVFLRPPGWMPAVFGGPEIPAEIDEKTYSKFNPKTSMLLNCYILIQFAIIIGITSLILFKTSELSLLQLAIGVVWILTAISGFGALLENKRWGVGTENFRLMVIPLILFLFTDLPSNLLIFVSGMAYATISIFVFRYAQQRHYRFINSEKT